MVLKILNVSFDYKPFVFGKCKVSSKVSYCSQKVNYIFENLSYKKKNILHLFIKIRKGLMFIEW
jgi:hypothetical protein